MNALAGLGRAFAVLLVGYLGIAALALFFEYNLGI